MVRCGKETILPRPFSIHRAEGGEIALLFSVVGQGHGAGCHSLKKGIPWISSGRWATALPSNPDSRNLLLVAGGMGIAPLRFLAEVAAGEGKKVTVIIGARSGELPAAANAAAESIQ